MALIDALIVTAVFFAFSWLIIARIRKKYPRLGNPLAAIFGGKVMETEPSLPEIQEISQQKYVQHRSMV